MLKPRYPIPRVAETEMSRADASRTTLRSSSRWTTDSSDAVESCVPRGGPSMPLLNSIDPRRPEPSSPTLAGLTHL
jgi:hypothetical protein